MSTDVYFYTGPYIKVFLPFEEATENLVTCTNKSCKEYGKYLHSVKFCSACGSPVDKCDVKKLEPLNMHKFLGDHLGDDDILAVIHKDWINAKDPREFCLVLANRTDQGGLCAEASGEYKVPDPTVNYFSYGVWRKFIIALDECKIKYEMILGCVVYER